MCRHIPTWFSISGHGLTLQHLRYNFDCDVYEELEPIDRNLQYDFDYQQIVHLPREKIILPVSYKDFIRQSSGLSSPHFQGDILQLKCFYGTESVDGVTLVSACILRYRLIQCCVYYGINCREDSALGMRCAFHSSCTIQE